MADLSEEIVITVLTLQQKLLRHINESTRYSFILFEQYGEIEATRSDLEILETIRERSTSYYTRFYRLLLQIFESQPTAASATLKLLTESIEQIEASVDAGEATIQEVKGDWNLL
jgi:hypothetical protein